MKTVKGEMIRDKGRKIWIKHIVLATQKLVKKVSQGP